MPVRTTLALGGTAYISCLAWLDNPRIIDDVSGYVVFDAVVSSSVPVDGTDRIIGSLRYEPKHAGEILTAGLYDIHAKVVTFQPNTHERSPLRADEDFAFMGDLLELRPVADETGHKIFSGDRPARLFASGRVSGLDGDINAFTVIVWQTVNEASHVARVTVRGVLGINALTNNPLNHLPPLNAFVSLTGDIITFEEGVIMVALDDVSYVACPCSVCSRDSRRSRAAGIATNFDDID